VYAPTADKQSEQLAFLDTIIPYANEYSHKIVIAGDFNTYLSDLDKYGKTGKLTEYNTRINTLINELDLCDIFRVLNPELKRYTWRKLAYNSIQQSRLDYIIIPVSLTYSVKNIAIGHSIYSDHRPVHLELIDKVTSNKGRGFGN
jgi:exonuclease III